MTITHYSATYRDVYGVEYVASIEWVKHYPDRLAAIVRRRRTDGMLEYPMWKAFQKYTAQGERILLRTLKARQKYEGWGLVSEEWTQYSFHAKREKEKGKK